MILTTFLQTTLRNFLAADYGSIETETGIQKLSEEGATEDRPTTHMKASNQVVKIFLSRQLVCLFRFGPFAEPYSQPSY